MNADKLLEQIRRESFVFETAWAEEIRQHGRGALVFLPAEHEEGANGLAECEYWTLGEIRSSLRDLGAEDEFTLRWLLDCENNGGLPVIILAPDAQAGNFNLCFHRLKSVPD